MKRFTAVLLVFSLISDTVLASVCRSDAFTPMLRPAWSPACRQAGQAGTPILDIYGEQALMLAIANMHPAEHRATTTRVWEDAHHADRPLHGRAGFIPNLIFTVALSIWTIIVPTYVPHPKTTSDSSHVPGIAQAQTTQPTPSRWPQLEKEIVHAGDLRDTSAVASLIRMLHQRGSHWDSLIAEALGKIGDRRAVKPLIGLLDVKVSYDQELYQTGLHTQVPDSYLQRTVSQALAKMSDPRALEPLATLIAAGHEVHPDVVKALKSFPAPLVIQVLIKTLNDRPYHFETGLVSVWKSHHDYVWEPVQQSGNDSVKKILISYGAEAVAPLLSVARNEIKQDGRVITNVQEVLEVIRHQIGPKEWERVRPHSRLETFPYQKVGWATFIVLLITPLSWLTLSAAVYGIIRSKAKRKGLHPLPFWNALKEYQHWFEAPRYSKNLFSTDSIFIWVTAALFTAGWIYSETIVTWYSAAAAFGGLFCATTLLMRARNPLSRLLLGALFPLVYRRLNRQWIGSGFEDSSYFLLMKEHQYFVGGTFSQLPYSHTTLFVILADLLHYPRGRDKAQRALISLLSHSPDLFRPLQEVMTDPPPTKRSYFRPELKEAHANGFLAQILLAHNAEDLLGRWQAMHTTEAIMASLNKTAHFWKLWVGTRQLVKMLAWERAKRGLPEKEILASIKRILPVLHAVERWEAALPSQGIEIHRKIYEDVKDDRSQVFAMAGLTSWFIDIGTPHDMPLYDQSPTLIDIKMLPTTPTLAKLIIELWMNDEDTQPLDILYRTDEMGLYRQSIYPHWTVVPKGLSSKLLEKITDKEQRPILRTTRQIAYALLFAGGPLDAQIEPAQLGDTATGNSSPWSYTINPDGKLVKQYLQLNTPINPLSYMEHPLYPQDIGSLALLVYASLQPSVSPAGKIYKTFIAALSGLNIPAPEEIENVLEIGKRLYRKWRSPNGQAWKSSLQKCVSETVQAIRNEVYGQKEPVAREIFGPANADSLYSVWQRLESVAGVNSSESGPPVPGNVSTQPPEPNTHPKVDTRLQFSA